MDTVLATNSLPATKRPSASVHARLPSGATAARCATKMQKWPLFLSFPVVPSIPSHAKGIGIVQRGRVGKKGARQGQRVGRRQRVRQIVSEVAKIQPLLLWHKKSPSGRRLRRLRSHLKGNKSRPNYSVAATASTSGAHLSRVGKKPTKVTERVEMNRVTRTKVARIPQKLSTEPSKISLVQGSSLYRMMTDAEKGREYADVEPLFLRSSLFLHLASQLPDQF